MTTVRAKVVYPIVSAGKRREAGEEIEISLEEFYRHAGSVSPADGSVPPYDPAVVESLLPDFRSGAPDRVQQSRWRGTLLK